MPELAQSYVHGASATPLIGDTIGVHFDRAVARWPEADALVVRHQGIRWTYSDLQREVDALAAGLLALGLERGDRVGIWSPNNAEWVVTQFATAKAGIILVNVNPAYRLTELEYAINKVGCKALITQRLLGRATTSACSTNSCLSSNPVSQGHYRRTDCLICARSFV